VAIVSNRPRKTKRSAWYACVLFAALLAGCSDDSGAGADTGVDAAVDAAGADTSAVDRGAGADQQLEGGPDLAKPLDGGAASMAELCARQAALLCADVVSCCQGVAPKAADAAACRQAVEATCVTQATKEEAALSAGTARIDAAGLAACEALTAAAGKACRLPTAAAEQETCKNVVFATASVGQDCDGTLSGARCADGAGICFAQPGSVPCKAWGTQGQACSVAPCAPGLLCIADPSSAKPSICDAPRASGQPCPADAYCASGLACFDKLCGAALGVGGTCAGKASKCSPDLACDPFSETCQPRKTAGGSCYIARHCAAGFACSGVGTGLVCLPGTPQDGADTPGLPTLGQPCSTLCAKGFVCARGPLPGSCIPALCAAVLAAAP
jgi:hypothetical protein